MECGRAPGPLHRVDVGLDQETRLVEMVARLRVRYRDEPDVAALVRLSDRLDAAELRGLGRPGLQRRGQLVVPVEVVVRDRRQDATSSPIRGAVSFGSKPRRAAISSLDGFVPSVKSLR